MLDKNASQNSLALGNAVAQKLRDLHQIVDQNEKREKFPLEIELEFFIVGTYFNG